MNEYTQIGDTTYQYDANGNLIAATNGQTTTYTFNALNQLTGVSRQTGTFSYTYDALGYQISSTVNGQTTNNLINPWAGKRQAQFTGSGNLIAHYTYRLGTGQPGHRKRNLVLLRLRPLQLTVGITNAAGAYVNQYSYDPFGQVTTISAGDRESIYVRGAGRIRRRERAWYMRARYYDPLTGSFCRMIHLDWRGATPILAGSREK